MNTKRGKELNWQPLRLLLLSAGVGFVLAAVLGWVWGQPAAVFCVVSSMGADQLPAWIDTAKRAGAGWPRQ